MTFKVNREWRLFCSSPVDTLR